MSKKIKSVSDFPENDIQLPPLESESEDHSVINTRVDRLLVKGGDICAWLVLFAMIISVYEVFSRYVFDSPTSWVHETVIFIVASIFALGGPYALARDRHIQIRILPDLLSPEKRRWLEIFNILLGIGFCIGIGYAAYIMAFKATHAPTGEWRMQTSGSAWDSPLPTYTKIVILISIMLMAAQLLSRFGHLLRKKRSE